MMEPQQFLNKLDVKYNKEEQFINLAVTNKIKANKKDCKIYGN
jgi:hypothetical protein